MQMKLSKSERQSVRDGDRERETECSESCSVRKCGRETEKDERNGRDDRDENTDWSFAVKAEII